MPLPKRIVHYLLIPMLVFSFIACAGGPPPKRAPEHVRKSIYYKSRGAKLLNRGCYARALDYFQEAHQRYTAADNLDGVAQSLNSIGDLYYRLGDMSSALLVYEEAVAVYQGLPDESGLVKALSNKAATLISLDRLKDAAAVLDRADKLDSGGAEAAMRLKTRALLYIRQKDFGTAKDLLVQALSSIDESEPAIRGSIQFALGHVALKEGRIASARKAFQQALALDRANLAYDDIARDLQALGHCAVAEDNHADAVDYFKRSAKIFALLKNRPRTEEVVAQLKQSAARANVDIQAALHWIGQWVEDEKVVDLCD